MREGQGRVDPTLFGLAVQTVDGFSTGAGDSDVPFTLQSASKVFSLAAILENRGNSVFEKMQIEPSGDAFFSIVKLEEEHGHPRNPYINAGAILTSSTLPGRTPDEKIGHFREFLAREVASLRMSVGEVATRDFVRSELRSLLAELDERDEREGRDERPEPPGSR